MFSYLEMPLMQTHTHKKKKGEGANSRNMHTKQRETAQPGQPNTNQTHRQASKQISKQANKRTLLVAMEL